MVWREIDLRGGLNTDGNPDIVPITDMDNMVYAPDGSGLESRPGSNIHKTMDPIGLQTGINEVVIPQVPNINDGSMLSVSVESGSKRISSLSVVRPRRNFLGDTLSTSFFFYTIPYAAQGETYSLRVVRAGNLSTTHTIAYATSNGTASAGTDYTAASGTLTFSPGDATKTISVTVANTGQRLRKTFNVTLSSPSGGASISGNSTAVVEIRQNAPNQYFPLVYNISPVTSSGGDLPVMMWDYGTSYCYAHLLKDYIGYGGATTCTKMVRINQNMIGFVTRSGAGPTYTLTLNLWKMSSIQADGAAHVNGASAIKSAPDYTVSLGTTYASTDINKCYIYPYSGRETSSTTNTCYVLTPDPASAGQYSVRKINLNTGAVSSTATITAASLAGTYTWVVSDSTSNWGRVLPNGQLLLPLEESGGREALNSVNPSTGALAVAVNSMVVSTTWGTHENCMPQSKVTGYVCLIARTNATSTDVFRAYQSGLASTAVPAITATAQNYGHTACTAVSSAVADWEATATPTIGTAATINTANDRVRFPISATPSGSVTFSHSTATTAASTIIPTLGGLGAGDWNGWSYLAIYGPATGNDIARIYKTGTTLKLYHLTLHPSGLAITDRYSGEDYTSSIQKITDGTAGTAWTECGHFLNWGDGGVRYTISTEI